MKKIKEKRKKVRVKDKFHYWGFNVSFAVIFIYLSVFYPHFSLRVSILVL